MASIGSYKKADGKTYYFFRAYAGIDESGKQRQVKRKGFSSKKEANLAYLDFLKEQEEKEMKKSNKGDMTFDEVFNEWSKLYVRTVRESTAKATLGTYKNHFLPYFQNRKMREITRQDCQNFIVLLSNQLEDLKKVKNTLLLIFKYALSNEIIDKNPLDRVILPKREEVKEFENYLDKHEFQSFIALLEKHANPQWRAFFYLIAFTGLRRGEALALSWEDIDAVNRTLTVNKNFSKAYTGGVITPPKTKSSNRTIYISENVVKELERYQTYLMETGRYKKEIVFPNTEGSYITFSQPTRQLNSILRRGKFKHITPHGLRHTHCCLLFEAGASIAQVQHRLGHSDVKMTLEVYNHVTKAKVSEVADIFVNYVGLR